VGPRAVEMQICCPWPVAIPSELSRPVATLLELLSGGNHGYDKQHSGRLKGTQHTGTVAEQVAYTATSGHSIMLTQKLGHSESHTLRAWDIKKNGTV
jgi:hypothetical protein